MIKYTKYKKCYSSNLIFTEEVPFKIHILEINSTKYQLFVYNTVSKDSEYISTYKTLQEAKNEGKKYLKRIGIVNETNIRKTFLTS